MREDLMLSVNNFDATEESYDSLKEAVEKLSSASEAQFEEIKKEKWYNRVFDMVTFSQKGKKRLAEQIGTVAQAQQILLELLLRLSANDTRISDLVLKNRNSIERIQEQNIYLLDKIKKLENVALGIKKDTDISTLSQGNKELLCATIYYISEKYGCHSEEQRNFANSLIRYIDVVDVQMENPFEKFNDIDNDSKKKILACCMEYMFLECCDISCFEKCEDVLDEFDFGKKTIKEIGNQIQGIYNLRGAEGFYSKYQDENFEELDEFFYANFLDEIEIEEEPMEMEDFYVDKMFHIGREEKVKFAYKNVHLSSYIHCEGAVMFDHCVIYYNESEAGDEITLGEDAVFLIKDSTVICKGFDKKYFISGRNVEKILIDNSTLIDCQYFMDISYGNVEIFNCEMKNCLFEFLHFTMNSESGCKIYDNVIKEEKVPAFLGTNVKSLWNSGMINTCFLGAKDAESGICEFFNNTISRDKSFQKDIFENLYAYHLITGDNIFVHNCSFEGNGKCIHAFQIEDCVFIDCEEVIATQECALAYGISVENCNFERCTSVLDLEGNTKVKNSKFISCKGRIVYYGPDNYNYEGGVEIEFCEFKRLMTEWTYEGSYLVFRRHSKSSSKANYVRKCIFNGIDMKGGFLISADGYEKPSGTVTYIEDCDFRDFVNKNKSGAIIKEYMTYHSLLGEKVFQANVIRNCRGL